ncbi:hypothetical protein B0T14DRAFT_340368 [Immersiella caudata]|uniref:Uncharacterized protein n=1 Tax=Immersiella caudata TaxID=314043 RepID=A0AA39WBD4_9PEZI|nr:hypothetical protein B0T14DRAFT_340368 [Immersiella caudata]
MHHQPLEAGKKKRLVPTPHQKVKAMYFPPRSASGNWRCKNDPGLGAADKVHHAFQDQPGLWGKGRHNGRRNAFAPQGCSDEASLSHNTNVMGVRSMVHDQQSSSFICIFKVCVIAKCGGAGLEIRVPVI